MTVQNSKPYFVFSLAVLEGIAISFNPEYKVLGSTYPWIARKVLTDGSPQLKSSLENLLYKVSMKEGSPRLICGTSPDIVMINAST